MSATAWPRSISSGTWRVCALLSTSVSARVMKPSVLLSMSASVTSASSATAWPTSVSSSACQSCSMLNTSANARVMKLSLLQA